MSDYNKPFVDLSTLLPQTLRNRTNESLLKNIFNKMLTKDESLPLLGFIGDRLITDLRPALPQPNLERELNTLQPMVYAKIGSDEQVFTFNDVIQKLKLLGVDTDEMDTWAKAKSFNFVPPIDLDKFINYPRYYWYGKLQTPVLNTVAEPSHDPISFNPTLDAEYYVIGLPGKKVDQLEEVAAVCTLTDIDFNNPPNTVDDVELQLGDRVLVVNSVSANPIFPHAKCGIYTVTLDENDVTVWTRATDLSKTAQFKSGSYVFVRNGVDHAHTYWTLQVPAFMVLDQANIQWTRGRRTVTDWSLNNFWAHEDDLRLMGINPADCIQALAPIVEYDFDLELNNSVVNGKPSRPLASVSQIVMLNPGEGYNASTPPTVTIELPPLYPAVGVFKAEVEAEVINGALKINLVNPSGEPLGGSGYVDAPKITITGGGAWTHEAVAYAVLSGASMQTKYMFNQIPQFNLYYLDGSHANKTSAIFYYAESAEYSIDSVLKRRIVRDVNGDYTFEQGLLDSSKMQHFFKVSHTLRGIWHPGAETSPRWVKRGINGGSVDYPAGPKNKDALYGKADVAVASTGHITSLNGLQVIDGYQTVVGDRVLVKDQLVGAQEDNGIYVVGRGYVTTPLVTVVNAKPAEYFPTPANIICTINQGRVSSFRVIDGGSGYSRIEGETTISLVPSSGIGVATDSEPATANVVVDENGTITEVLLVDGGHWKRADDARIDSDVLHGMHMRVVNGDTQANTNWALSAPNPIVLDSSVLTFEQYEDGEGAWSIPAQMFHNLKHENRKQLGYGDLYEHFFSIIGAQPTLEGSSFGFNNWRDLDNRDLGLGGTIKDYNSSFDLFLGLMNQRDISVPSILDFAQLQYSQSLNTVNEFFTQNVSEFLVSGLLGSLNTINPNNDIITGLFEVYKGQVANRADLGTIYTDTTNPLTNWPATLPYLGLIYDPENPTMAKKVKPGVEFDRELGLYVIVHHDGHRTPAAMKNAAYEQALTKTPIPRSNGMSTPGIFSSVAPSLVNELQMFRNQLWYNPISNELYFFDVTSDTSPIYPVEHGQFYFNRSNSTLYRWDQSLNGNLGEWVVHSNIADAWKPFYFHNILNSLILRIENELYNNVQPLQPSVWDSTTALASPLLELELAKYAAQNNYDMFAPDYVPSNAFTWNYASLTNGMITGLSMPVNTRYPARWFNLYKAYFKNTTTGLSTCRPNLEPWVLTGQSETAFRTMWNQNTFNTPNMWNYVKSVWGRKLSVNIVGDKLTNPNYGSLLPPYVNPNSAEAGEALLNIIPDQISAGYRFGDDGPVELVWKKSLEFNYAVLRTAFRIDPINFISKTWGLNKAVVNEYELDRSAARRESWLEFKLHGDTINNPISRDLDKLIEPLIANQLKDRYTEATPRASLFDGEASCFAGYDAQSGVWQDYPLATPEAPVKWLLKDLTLTPTGGIWRTVFIDAEGNESERPPVAIGVPYIDRWISFVLRDNGLDYELHDRITITYDGMKYGFEFSPSRYKLFNGLNQTYVNLLRYNGSDPSISFNVVMLRNWELKLGYRVSGLVNTDTLKMSSDNFSLHKSSFRALLKQNPAQQESWLDALRVQLVRIGTTQWDSAGYNIPKEGLKANDWQFRIENFNPRHPSITYYNLDTAGSYQTFNALVDANALKARQDAQIALSDAQTAYQTLLQEPASPTRDANLEILYQVLQEATDALAAANAKNEEWRIYRDIKIDETNADEALRTDRNGLITRSMPFVVTGLQNVLNVIYGYIARLLEDGWAFNAGDQQIIDQETGRAISWQLDIEKLIKSIYNGAVPGTGNVLNPFMGSVWFNTPRGMLGTFDRPLFSDINTSQLVFDVLGGTISKSNLRVFRQDEDTEVVSNIPMMSAHFLVDEYEHVILFANYNDMSQQKDLIYDPFLGVRINRIYVEGQRQMSFNGRPSYGGHYINGQSVHQNIEASVDGILNYYDSNEISKDSPTAKAARELLGYQKKDYMAQIDMSDQSQFHFWRGLIHNKGSNNSMDAFLNSAKFKSASMDEYWAVKIADYGDARTKSFPELKLKASDCIHSFTRLQFLETSVADTIDPSYTTIMSSDENRWFSIDDVGTHMYFDAELLGTELFANINTDSVVNLPWSAEKVEIYIDDVRIDDDIVYNGIWDTSIAPAVQTQLPWVINGTTIRQPEAGAVTVSVIGYGPAKPKFSPIKLIDYAGQQLISEIPIWDPANGVHQVNASEVIDITSSSDPGRYNYSVQTVGNTNYDPLRPWGSDQIGKTWFDTTNLGYVPYNDAQIFPTTDERLSRWGVPADWATVDVYEWVGAKVPPREWDAIAKAEEGNAEIPVELRASGKVARKELYVRERTWKERPIAWSYSANPPSIYHQLTSSGLAGIRLSSTLEGHELVVLEYGRFSDFDVNGGMHLSAIDFASQKPIGEGVLDGIVNYQIGGSTLAAWNAPYFVPDANFDNMNVIPSPSSPGRFGEIIGPIVFSQIITAAGAFVRATSLNSNINQDIAISDIPDIVGASVVYDFDTLGVAFTANTTFDHTSVLPTTLPQATLDELFPELQAANADIAATDADIAAAQADIDAKTTAYNNALVPLDSAQQSHNVKKILLTAYNQELLLNHPILVDAIRTEELAITAFALSANPAFIDSILLTSPTIWSNLQSALIEFNTAKMLIDEYAITWKTAVFNRDLAKCQLIVANAMSVTDPARSAAISTATTALANYTASAAAARTEVVTRRNRLITAQNALSAIINDSAVMTGTNNADVLNARTAFADYLMAYYARITEEDRIINIINPKLDDLQPWSRASYALITRDLVQNVVNEFTGMLAMVKDMPVTYTGRMDIIWGYLQFYGIFAEAAQRYLPLCLSYASSTLSVFNSYQLSDPYPGIIEAIQSAIDGINTLTSDLQQILDYPGQVPPVDFVPDIEAALALANQILGFTQTAVTLTISDFATGATTTREDDEIAAQIVADAALAVKDAAMAPLTSAQAVKAAAIAAKDVITQAVNRKIAVLTAFGNIEHDVYVRETMGVDIFLSFDQQSIEMHNETDISNYGWKAYTVPSAADLANELAAPKNRWQPYYGDYVELDFTPVVRDRLASYASDPLIFADNTGAAKVISTWSDWLPQRDEKLTVKYLGNLSDLTFGFVKDPKNVSVYVNGLIQPFATYTVAENEVTSHFDMTLNLTPTIGDEVTVINRRYKPTDAELAFDPNVEDDPTTNVQYKYDYQYVIESIRDSSGNIVAIYYYFWVYDKSTPTKGNKMSIKNAANLLKNNTYPYMVLMGAKDSYQYVSGFDVPQPFEYSSSDVFTLDLTGTQLTPITAVMKQQSAIDENVFSDVVVVTGFEIPETPVNMTATPSVLRNGIMMTTEQDPLFEVVKTVPCQIFTKMTEMPVRYTKVAIKGLNQLVTQDNTYKLRFTKDFTLRDNPEDIRLKNVHQEWTLIREAQLKRIPNILWDRLVDAACGQNAGGELLPAQSRLDYDLRHNTTTRYGTDTDQILVDTDIAKKSILNTILNTKITYEQGGVKYSDYIADLDFGALSGSAQEEDRMEAWFGSVQKTRETLTTIWNSAKPRQINEIFFAVLHDALSANIEMTDIFKTSYLSVYSVRLLSTVDVLKKLNGAA